MVGLIRLRRITFARYTRVAQITSATFNLFAPGATQARGRIVMILENPSANSEAYRCQKAGYLVTDDIRLKFSFLTSAKRKRLRRILGPASDTYLMDFLLNVGMRRSDGDISDWDSFTLADLVNFPGDPDELYNALLDCGWIVNRRDKKRVVNWEDHQRNLMYKDRRIIQARLAAAVRHGNTSEANRLRKQLYGKEPTNQHVTADSTPDSMQNALPTSPHLTLNTNRECQNPTCNKPVDQPHHSKCRTCYQPNYRDPPTTRHQQYPRCPYCRREQSGIEVDHQAMNCNICEDEPK